MRKATLVVGCTLLAAGMAGAEGRNILPLNGTWQFQQTRDAFPPRKFTRTCPVPGLIHLARPRVEDYDRFFPKPPKVQFRDSHDLSNRLYDPKYSWYRRTVAVPAAWKDRHAVLTLLKSQYVTQAFINGKDLGMSMACSTPIDFPSGHAVRFGETNEILVRVGDRAWLPSEAAGGTDKEKVTYLPGIWDDAFLSFTGPFRIHRLLVLPSVAEKKVTAKLLVRSFYPAQTLYGAPMQDACRVEVVVREKTTGQRVASLLKTVDVKRDNLTPVVMDIPLPPFRPWTPDDPFLYEADVLLSDKGVTSDTKSAAFGMRDFTRAGKYFSLNAKQVRLRGTNITLHRFFEDPECEALPWNRAWVKKLLADIPKTIHWNAMRICVGLVPDFWYGIADSAGLLLQNEWLYWQNHGWDEQIRTEYTDWVWADGCHPSIAIWDAMNENWDPFIGNILIPELKKLDPTRIWDAGYMTAEHMAQDEMDEPHPYMVGNWQRPPAEWKNSGPLRLGDLDFWPDDQGRILGSSAVQLVNEYGWFWLWRNGLPSFLTVNVYNYHLRENSNPDANRGLQAYRLQLETEWLRTERSIAGVLAFCYLTNNCGFTGDWFLDPIRALKPGPTLHWFAHCFSPAAVFIDLPDERYEKRPPHDPGSGLAFNLVGVNDLDRTVTGRVSLSWIDAAGQTESRGVQDISIPAYGKTHVPVCLTVPTRPGGYCLLADFRETGESQAILSRRYVNVGPSTGWTYAELKPPPIE